MIFIVYFTTDDNTIKHTSWLCLKCIKGPLKINTTARADLKCFNLNNSSTVSWNMLWIILLIKYVQQCYILGLCCSKYILGQVTSVCFSSNCSAVTLGSTWLLQIFFLCPDPVRLRFFFTFNCMQGIVDGCALLPAPRSCERIVHHASDSLHVETDWYTLRQKEANA